MKIKTGLTLLVFTLSTLAAYAGEVRVGDYSVSCEMRGQCVIGGNPLFICTVAVDNTVMSTTVVYPFSPIANIDVALGEKELKGKLTSYYGKACGVKVDFKTTSPDDVYRGEI